MPDAQFTAAGPTPLPQAWQSAITVVQEAELPFIPVGAHEMTIVVAWPPGQDELARRQSRRSPAAH
jgi:hypothetical protein